MLNHIYITRDLSENLQQRELSRPMNCLKEKMNSMQLKESQINQQKFTNNKFSTCRLISITT